MRSGSRCHPEWVSPRSMRYCGADSRRQLCPLHQGESQAMVMPLVSFSSVECPTTNTAFSKRRDLTAQSHGIGKSKGASICRGREGTGGRQAAQDAGTCRSGCPPFEPANLKQVEGTDFQKSAVKGHRSTDMEPERARYQKDLRDFEYTISQTRAKYQSMSLRYLSVIC
jgi:hypothetical protein